MIIAGIGSRLTPGHALIEMLKVGRWCRHNKVYVRSGHAPGADQAFENGAQEYCIAYLPWSSFESDFKSRAHKRIPEFTPELEKLARKFHPAFDRLKEPVQKLMMRNGCQILGEKLDSPVNAVVCWTSDGLDSGGTGQALRIAKSRNIDVINMYNYPTATEVISELTEYLESAA